MLCSYFSVEYSDEAGNDPAEDVTDPSNQNLKKAYIVQSYTVKKLIIEGITFSTMEFSVKARTFSRSVIFQSQMDVINEDQEQSFISTFERNSLNEQLSIEQQSVDPTVSVNTLNDVVEKYRHVIMFGKVSSTQEVSYLNNNLFNINHSFGTKLLFLLENFYNILITLLWWF